VGQGVTQVVLVVDDDPGLRLLCRVNLELDGFGVAEAGTLAEARTAMDAEPVALVLLDLHVGIDLGHTLLDEIRGHEPRIPVVVVTGSADVDSGELRIDADAVLAKPFTIDELMRVVHSLADGTGAAGRAAV
jgi:two-component system OmpR family response regulator